MLPLYLAARRTGARVVLTDWSDPTRVLHMFRYLEPAVHCFLTPPMAMAFREALAASGEDPREVFGGAFIWAGDSLTPKTRALLTDEWGAEVFELSGTGDLSYMMMECEAHDGLHAHDDMWFVEVVEPGTTEAVPEGGRGEFLFTALADSSLAFFRWRSEDIGYLDARPCTCGRTSTRLRFLGRVGYRVTVGGRMIFPVDVQRVMETIPEADHGLFQIVKTGAEMDRLRLRVGHRPADLADPASLGRRIEGALESSLGLPAAVEFVEAETLLALGPPHKIPRIHEP
jgi:phenylacetate-CoA ligase